MLHVFFWGCFCFLGESYVVLFLAWFCVVYYFFEGLIWSGFGFWVLLFCKWLFFMIFRGFFWGFLFDIFCLLRCFLLLVISVFLFFGFCVCVCDFSCGFFNSEPLVGTSYFNSVRVLEQACATLRGSMAMIEIDTLIYHLIALRLSYP